MSLILIVDDHEQNRYLLRAMLAPHGHEVLEADNGAEALELARRTRPDLIISDILMPQMDGFALCRECKRDEQLREVPFIFYTATYTDPRDEALALQLGAARFVVKPVESEDFTAILREVLQASAAGQLAAPAPPLEEETAFYRLYNEALIRKLEDKMLDLDRLNRSLAESEERFRRLAENAPDLIYRYRLSPNPGFEYVSPAATGITGYTPEEHYADPELGFKLVHPDDRPILEAMRAGAVQSGEPVTLRWVRKDGQIIWTEQRNVPIVDEHGTVIALEGIARDVTARMRAEESVRRRAAELEGLYLTSMQTLARGDLHGLLTAIVERAARFTGGDRGTLFLLTADGARIRVHISHNMGRDYTGTELELGEGISGRAALERRAFMIEDYSAWEGKSPKFRNSGISRVLAVPMLVGERLIGVLNVADLKTGSYGEDEIRLASLFANQAAMAVESVRLMDETSRRAAYLEALTSTAEALGVAVAPEAMYAKVLEEVARQLRPEGATLSLLVPEDGEIETVLAVGAWEETTGMRLPVGVGIVGSVTSSGMPFVSDDIRGDPRLARPELLKDLPAVACVPLTVEGRSIGCVMVGRHTPLRAEEVRLLTGLAEIGGNAIHRARVMATLEERVSQRTQELEAANRELEAFAYSVSHDLRAPLRAIHGFSEALLSESQGQLDEQGRHYLNRIGVAAEDMGELIDALLDLSRIARREMRQQPVDLSVLAREVAGELQTQDEQRRVEWLIADKLPARGDAHLLSLALQNLLGNAWKFTGPRPQARIEVGALPRTSPASAPGSGKDEAGLVYFVRDNGVGFDMAYADKLFAPFQRLHGTREFPGTGIGLATVQRIIARHNGRIWAEAEVDRGATFFFTLESA